MNVAEWLAGIRAKIRAAGGEEAYLEALPRGEPDDIDELRRLLADDDGTC